MSSTPPPALPHANYERFESTRQYESMLDELVPQTQRVIRVFDKTLSAAWNASARCAAVSAFLRADPLNRLYIVVHDAGAIERLSPRFATLVQRYGHLVKVRQTPRAARHLYDAFVIFDASHYLHRVHHDHMRYARGLNELDGTQQLLDRFNELWEVSTPALASGVVGL
jgi:hypothetical protein